MDISSISLSGFKSIIDEQNLKISPLTIISGSNSGGKTSFLQPLLLIKQTLESTFDPGSLLINGANVKFSETKQLFSLLKNGQQHDAFTLKFYLKDNSVISLTYKQKDKSDVVIECVKIFDKENMKEELEINLQKKIDDIMPLLPQIFIDFVKQIHEQAMTGEVVRERAFLVVKFLPINNKSKQVFMPGIGFHPCLPVEKLCKNLIHLSGLRGKPERIYNKTSVGSFFPGTFENYTASVIYSWINSSDSNGLKKIKKLETYLKQLGLTCKITSKKINDTNLGVYVSRLLVKNNGINDLVNIADVGLGVSQALPVLVALLVAEKNQVVFLEQPEIHLHPKAQWELAKPIVEAAKRGVNVILETHSSLLIRGIQTLVAQRKIDNNLVSLNWFSRNKKTGATTISNTILDRNGAFGEWPEDFDSTTLHAEKEYLDAVGENYEEPQFLGH